MNQLSALEIRRLENIRQNEAFLAQLHLETVRTPKKEVKKRLPPVVHEKSRQSTRTAKFEPVDYVGRMRKPKRSASDILDAQVLQRGDVYKKQNGINEHQVVNKSRDSKVFIEDYSVVHFREIYEANKLRRNKGEQLVELQGVKVSKPIAETTRHEIKTVSTDYCDANLERFLCNDQLGQPVDGVHYRGVASVLLPLAVEGNSEKMKVIVNPENKTQDVIQFKNALFILTRTDNSVLQPTEFYLQSGKFLIKWPCRKAMNQHNVYGCGLLNRLQRAIKYPEDVNLLLFNLNFAQSPFYISCGRLKVLEFSAQHTGNYFLFELVDSDVLIQAGVELICKPPVKRVFLETHESFGTRIAEYFKCGARTQGAELISGEKLNSKGTLVRYTVKGSYQKLFTGVVTKYAPPTSHDKQDQLYHIVFEDEEEEDWEFEAFQTGVKLYEKKRQQIESKGDLAEEVEAWQEAV